MHLNTPEITETHPNLPDFFSMAADAARRGLWPPEFTEIHLNFPEYTWVA